MPNYLTTETLYREAERLASPIEAPALRVRLVQLFARALYDDPRNARKAGARDLQGAQKWALEAYAERRPVHVFRAHPSALRTLEALASSLQAELQTAPLHADSQWTREATTLRQRCESLSLADVTERLARLRNLRLRAEARGLANAPRCEEGRVSVRGGVYWVRLCSLVELRRAGQELRNCWASQQEDGPYARLMSEGEIWVLRYAQGPARAGFAVRDGIGVELRGPRNAHFSPFCWEVVVLMAARRIALRVPVLGREMLADAEKIALWVPVNDPDGGFDPSGRRERRRTGPGSSSAP